MTDPEYPAYRPRYPAPPPPWDPPPRPSLAPKSPAIDWLAVAVGNASLLGVGYLMLGRRGLALANMAVTVVLACVLAEVARSAWFEIVVLVWWAAVIAHGGYLASRRDRPAAVRRPWVAALSVTVPVLLAVGLLRFDVSQTEGIVADARAGADCTRVLSAQHGVWFGDRVADSPLAARGDQAVQVCHDLTRVRQLLEGSPDDQPKYCFTPARYGDAAPYSLGTNRALFYGDQQYTGALPGGWKASDAAQAVLVVCAGTPRQGSPADSCTYGSPPPPVDVTFHKIAVPVKAYELRTGKLVYNGTVQINGASCPDTVYVPHGLTSWDTDVKPSADDERAAFSPVINR